MIRIFFSIIIIFLIVPSVLFGSDRICDLPFLLAFENQIMLDSPIVISKFVNSKDQKGMQYGYNDISSKLTDVLSHFCLSKSKALTLSGKQSDFQPEKLFFVKYSSAIQKGDCSNYPDSFLAIKGKIRSSRPETSLLIPAESYVIKKSDKKSMKLASSASHLFEHKKTNNPNLLIYVPKNDRYYLFFEESVMGASLQIISCDKNYRCEKHDSLSQDTCGS